MRNRSDPLADVSRETIEKLEYLQALAIEWNSKINLVSKSTVPDFWTRHIVDSAQLYDLADNPDTWCDLGSGGGFPGLVVGVLQGDLDIPTRLTLVESDKRKCAFLLTASRRLEINCAVKMSRIEEIGVECQSTVSARALAGLDKLLQHSQPFLHPSSECLFPKGKNWKNELRIAQEKWQFDYSVVNSCTDPEAVILKITNIERGQSR